MTMLQGILQYEQLKIVKCYYERNPLKTPLRGISAAVLILAIQSLHIICNVIVGK